MHSSLAHARSAMAALLLGWCALSANPAAAVEPDEVLRDPALEQRARSISAELRCVVCQNQSIDDSAAPLAKDLRLLVRERLVAGDSDDAVRAFIVARYGEFVLLKPPFGADTLLLWATPLLVLGAAGVGVFVGLRRMRARQAAAPPRLSAEESARLEHLLKRDA